MSNAVDYVNYFYDHYNGRVAIGVGYDGSLTEIYPLVFQDSQGESIGMVALAALPDKNAGVYIYHLSAFITQQGNGSKILKELCEKADELGVDLNVSAIFSPNGKDPKMAADQLIKWYERFGFSGNAGLSRKPANSVASDKIRVPRLG